VGVTNNEYEAGLFQKSIYHLLNLFASQPGRDFPRPH